MSNQDIKRDAGKPRLTLVPSQILYDIAEVREYGVEKYGTSESWKEVEIQRYRNAAYRHWLAYCDNPSGVDDESGIQRLKHLACNIAFLCELEKTRTDPIKVQREIELANEYEARTGFSYYGHGISVQNDSE